MRILPLFAAMTAAAFLSACNEEVASCTQAEAEQKLAALTTKMQEVATTAPEKLAELAPKMQEIATKAQAATTGSDQAADLAASCKAIDDMMAELG